jgi:hypothetical protein
MADYYSLLSRAIAGLETSTEETRLVLYRRVREILVDNLRNQQPPVSEVEIERERLMLEDAIRKVELSSTRIEPAPTPEKTGVVRQEKSQQIKAFLAPITKAPALWRLNGCGCTLLGLFRDPDMWPLYFCVHTFTILWVPICPLGIFLVRATGDRSYQFHGSISAANFGKLYPNGVLRLAGSCLLEGAVWIVVVLLIFGVIALAAPHGHYGFRARF